MTVFHRSIHIPSLYLTLMVGLGMNSGDLRAQPIPFDWRSPTVANNTYGDEVRDLAVDTLNNFIYVVGVVKGGAPYGLQAYTASAAPRLDVFLIKLNLDGSLVWSTTLGGTGSNELNAVAIGPDGNIYVTGSFQNTVNGQASTNGSDILVASYAPLSGSLNWSKSVAGGYQGEDQHNHDGMDISICEFDVSTKHLRASAAMHDLFILSNGTLRRERGTRHSIGGALGKDPAQLFSIIETPLFSGDRVYLFTDGIPDQFGGPQGKKLKVTGLFAWIEETAALPMAEQSEQLRLRFDAWIGDQDQVDDVLLIGIEV